MNFLDFFRGTDSNAGNATTGGGSTSALGRLATRGREILQSVSLELRLTQASKWRATYNPLRSLTIRRAVGYLEESERGAMAGLQWLYRYIEKRDATLGALVERRTGAIKKLSWDIRIPEELEGEELAIAEKQRDSLKAAYDHIRGFRESLSFLALASFRGFSHLEKLRDESGKVAKLNPIPQWYWVRDGIEGEWEFNASAHDGQVRGDQVDLSRFLLREVERPINEVGVIVFVRKNLSQVDWDAYIETYGIPPLFIILPEGTPPDKEADYLTAAESVASASKGALPGGSKVETLNTGQSGESPFKSHLDYQDAQLVMRGTGGKLTMLNDSTGIGGSQGDVHERVFQDLAVAEAEEISELFRNQLDAELLAQAGHGAEKIYAYFTLEPNEETDAGAFVEGVAALASAGYQVSVEQIAEKTGYDVTITGAPLGDVDEVPEIAPPAETLEAPDATDTTEAPGETAEMENAVFSLVQSARSEDARELQEALTAVFALPDDQFLDGLDALMARLPDFLEDTEQAELAWGRVYAAALTQAEEREIPATPENDS